MLKTRIQFAKGGALRYIGHLDFLRVFGQTVRRTGLPVAFSQGFNPHILLTFALPLPLGMASTYDYADLTFTEGVDVNRVAAALQAQTPAGLEIHRVWETQGRNGASLCAAADYTLAGTPTVDILAATEWIISKKTKSGLMNTDIRPDIFNVVTEGETTVMRLAAGSGRFLHPLVAAEILLGRTVTAGEIQRTELYGQTDTTFVPLEVM